ncbi:alpha/beta hydrolase family protein [Paenibacillus sp. GP183]|uniref:alpha/beta hydrolase n=1 Tax=Paenibacillus sp. GP183 TaxID=1882751 RepID=UPI0008983E41|nr:alpha/beta hydrolase family protein [Paenibacillus sp. GP183]SEC82536.1 S-formylglutathione hydrolase FrmB [Paenibacillus sp. GP183]
MALIQCDFFSETLGLSTSMMVILPQSTQGQIGMKGTGGSGKHPTLYLLHGLSDDHTIWLRRTSIERYVASLGLAVVMPAVHRSFYTDMKIGNNYWTFVSEELPRIAQSFFPLSDRREDNFASGLSMGGYGAFKLGLRCPDRFAAVASLSGALDATALDFMNRSELDQIFGSVDEVRGSAEDLFFLAEQAVRSGALVPKLYQCCGTEDFLYSANQRFLDHARKLNMDLTYEEEPGGHDWGYWDRKIQSVLNWLPLPGRV